MECSVGSSKHLQTRRFLDTLKQYLIDVRTMIVQLHRQANERPRPLEPSSPRQKNARLPGKNTNQLVDGAAQRAEERKPERKGSLLKKTGSEVHVLTLNGEGSEEEDVDLDLVTSGYSFFDSGDVEVLNPQRRRPVVGEYLLTTI
jgi:carnitine O-acetyltransferase